jgi:membrane-associated phospholipid phosphatase
MSNKIIITTVLIIIITLIYLYSLPRYITFLPTLPFYDNNEANEVFTITQNRNDNDEYFFNLTNESIIHAFSIHVNETNVELNEIITSPLIVFIVYIFKYAINRPRPYQINKNIDYLYSNTGETPSMPAGHALQAYYLSHVLSQLYPDKKSLFQNIAKKCDETRVKAGIHYPSDGIFSKKIVDFMIFIRII